MAESFTAESFKVRQIALKHNTQLYCTAEGFTIENFIAQQKVLLHNRKVIPAAETGEKFLSRQTLEKSSF